MRRAIDGQNSRKSLTLTIFCCSYFPKNRTISPGRREDRGVTCLFPKSFALHDAANLYSIKIYLKESF